MPEKRRKIDYKASVQGDRGRLDPPVAVRILRRIEKALASEGHHGEPRSAAFAGLYRLRVGDHRVIFARTEEGYLVLRIGRRREVYRRGRP
ncbi:MAG TPA: type II toxin-antitoxin system RelE/ParE family toxin [Thermoanaerobaculia bacterium]